MTATDFSPLQHLTFSFKSTSEILNSVPDVLLISLPLLYLKCACFFFFIHISLVTFFSAVCIDMLSGLILMKGSLNFLFGS